MVFDSYWRFAEKRQRLFRQRLCGLPKDVGDPVLHQFRFTNAYRASDRVSQRLIRDVIYDGVERNWAATFFRVVLFKLFNRESTWDRLVAALGRIELEDFDIERYTAVLDSLMADGGRVYSAAYIMPNPASYGGARKHSNHLRLLSDMLKRGVPDRMVSASSMSAAYQILAGQPSIGTFLAYQLVTDLNYSPHLAYSEDEFVQPGPGAVDGVRRCFRDLGGLNEADVIRWVVETQEEQFDQRGINFPDLWGRRLRLIDAQNLFCEVDKYARAAHPEIAGRRSRIKQRYTPALSPVTAWYPPKWGINDHVTKWLGQQGPRTRSGSSVAGPRRVGAASPAHTTIV